MAIRVFKKFGLNIIVWSLGLLLGLHIPSHTMLTLPSKCMNVQTIDEKLSVTYLSDLKCNDFNLKNYTILNKSRTFVKEKIINLLEHNDYNSYVTYYLGGKYTKIHGNIPIMCNLTMAKPKNICISTDTDSICVKDELKNNVPIEFSIDVTGIQWLKIQTNDCTQISKILDNWTLE